MPEKIILNLSEEEILTQFEEPADRQGEDTGTVPSPLTNIKRRGATNKVKTPNIVKIPAHPANYWKGRKGVIKSIAMHTMAGSYEGTNSWFQNPAAVASTNYGIAQNGRTAEYLDPFGKDAPFANGYVCKPDAEAQGVIASVNGANLNYHTISIEHEDKKVPNTQITDHPLMFAASTHLTAWLCEKFSIDPNAPGALLGHYQIDLCGRSGCPGWNNKTWTAYYAEVNKLLSTHVPPPPPPPPPAPVLTDPFAFHEWTSELANIVARNGFTVHGKTYKGQAALEYLSKNGISLAKAIYDLNEEVMEIKKHLGLI